MTTKTLVNDINRLGNKRAFLSGEAMKELKQGKLIELRYKKSTRPLTKSEERQLDELIQELS